MSDAVFPDLPGLSLKLTRTPQWKTRISEAWNGEETCITQRAWPRWRYLISYEFLRTLGASDLQSLIAFFNARRGSFDEFLFLDPEFNTVTNQGFGTGDGSRNGFQLARSMDTWVEPTYGPKLSSPSPVIKVAGVEQDPDSYSISARGVVTFDAPPTGALTWTGMYYMRCRFGKDSQDFERFMLQGLYQASGLEIISKVYQ